jgi:biotin carboxylase
MLGRRVGAIRAARQLGLQAIVCIDESAPRREPGSGIHYERCDFNAPLAEWKRLADGWRTPGFRAVLALTERSVLPTAYLRRWLGLSGTSVSVALRCTDKWRMKRAIRAAGLHSARFLRSEQVSREPGALDVLGWPVVLKPRRGSGGRGRRILRSAAELPASLPQRCMLESFVSGREMSVESFVAGGEILFTNPTEYLEPAWANVLPAELDGALLAEVGQLNRAALAALGIADGMTHLELFLTPAGLAFGEVAVRPPGGHIMAMLDLAYGFDSWRALLELALGRRPPLPAVARRTAGVQVLHPGRGRVRRVEGLALARELPGVERVQLGIEAGSVVSERIGVGQEVGHILVSGRDRNEVVERLQAARRALHIELDEG